MLASLHAVFTFGLLSRKVGRNGLRGSSLHISYSPVMRMSQRRFCGILLVRSNFLEWRFRHGLHGFLWEMLIVLLHISAINPCNPCLIYILRSLCHTPVLFIPNQIRNRSRSHRIPPPALASALEDSSDCPSHQTYCRWCEEQWTRCDGWSGCKSPGAPCSASG